MMSGSPRTAAEGSGEMNIKAPKVIAWRVVGVGINVVVRATNADQARDIAIRDSGTHLFRKDLAVSREETA
jgi:hypothetical protein